MEPINFFSIFFPPNLLRNYLSPLCKEKTRRTMRGIQYIMIL